MTYRERAQEAIAGKHPNSRGWIRGTCPFCDEKLGTPDRRGSLSANPELGRWHCFRCGAGGKLRDEEQVTAAPPTPKFLPPQGFEREVWRQAGVGVCLSGPYFGRIVIPILAGDERTWSGYVTRSWVKKATVPYLYAQGMNRAELLYNSVALTAPSEEPVLVVEGCLDALAYWPHAVALLGKASPPQFDMLVASPRPISVVLDGDAWREGYALAMRLRLAGQRAGWVKLPPGLDPDQMPRDELRAQAQKSLDD